MKILEVRSCAQWRQWLAKNHRVESEVWLVFYKRHTGRPSISYPDALDEALCFGWIDSLIKRLDDERYARKFTPRKADSRWSAANRKRWEQLKAADRLTPAGLDRRPTDRSYERPIPSPAQLPPYIRDALQKHPAARTAFAQLAPSHRRRYVLWVHTAKRPETRQRRLREAVKLLAAGRSLGLK